LAAVLACAGCGHGKAAVAGTRDVAFASGSLQLKGTVQVPEQARGRRPAVVLVHGSGPQSRDAELAGQVAMGFGCDISLFEELADGLEAAGFVVLRYDKRTCGPFNGCADNGYPSPSVMHVVDDLVKDAGAAARWLAKQREVDPERIYVVGHSEGGQLVPRLLTDVAELRGGVMLAAPYFAVDTVMLGQVAFLDGRVLVSGQAENEHTAAVLKDLHGQVAALNELRAGTYRGTRIGGALATYWKSWMTLGDEAPGLAAATPKPILVLSGDYDWNVPRNETEEWQAAFEAAPATSAQHETLVLPCVTHAMNCVRQPVPELIKPVDIGCSVDPRVIEHVVSFLKRR
jgi:dienelactone hydrolase